MSAEKILNQDEIDALINGVDIGAVSTEPRWHAGEVRAYDFQRPAAHLQRADAGAGA